MSTPILADTNSALATLCRLKGLNIGLEIDHFGTGYSSLSYLQRLPFDTVKIDRSFIREIERDSGSAVIILSITDLSRLLGMTTVAEGVENEAQLQRLTELGCDHIRGYHFSKPVAGEQAFRLLTEFGMQPTAVGEALHALNTSIAREPALHEVTI